MNAQPETENAKTIPIQTLNEFMVWVEELKGEQYLFRGLPCADYDIKASAYLRLYPEAGPEQLLEMNKELIKDARLQGHDYRDGRKLYDLEVLAELQHFRAATCLIDFTYSATVALWFTCQPISDYPNGKVSAIRNDPFKVKEITPELLSKDIDHFFKEDIDPSFRADENSEYPLYLWQPSQLNNRIISQHSVFLFGYDKIIEPDVECVIAVDGKQRILESLKSFSNISDATLFSDFDGFVRRRSHDIPYPHPSASEYKERGNRALQRAEYQAAINDYTQAIKHESNDAEAHNNRGVAYAEIDDFPAAISDFNRALELQPDYAEAHNKRGTAYYNIDDFQAAISDFNRAIELQPDYAEAHNNRGVAYAEIDDFPAAISDFNRALELQPNYPKAYHNRGVTYGKIDDFPAAIKDSNTALELYPYYAKAYNNRGTAHYNIGDFQAAIRDYNTAIELKPDYAEAYKHRGVAYTEIGDFQAAINDFNTAIELKPNYVEVYRDKGAINYRAGDFRAAIRNYTHAIGINPQDALTYCNRGLAQARLGNAREAEQDFQTALNLAREAGNEEIIVQIKQHLRDLNSDAGEKQ